MQEPEYRILVVEDEEIVAVDIQSQLESLGYQVVGRASTAKDAQRQAASAKPDLVLMDIRLDDDSDGIDAACRIREQFQVPVVFLTAYLDADTLRRAKAAQPHGYIVKPFDERDLHTAIQIAIHRGRIDRELRQSRDDLAAILDAQRHGTIMTDEEGRVTFVSRVAEQITGLGRDQAVGKCWREVLALSNQETTRLENMLQQPPGQRGKLEVSFLGIKRRRSRLEIEAQDDPRDADRKVLFLYDVSQLHELRRRLDERSQFENILGKSKPMQAIFQLIRDLARVDSVVLIEGETGTGKELVARAIHRRSRRSEGPFVALNCAGLSEELAASQLFGHRRGAFTGAVDDQVGLFEAATGGTLFLDEIGDLSLRVQTTLLRVLEENAVRRIGESSLRPVNTRIIAATNRDLGKEADENRFRRDLLYRIRVGRIKLPLLCERREDLPILARAFCADLAVTTGKHVDSVGHDAMSILMAYRWPGNVRELRNALEFAVIHARGTILEPADLPPEILEHACDVGLWRDPVEDDRGRLLAALERAGGNRKEAAAMLGISRATFYRRLAQLGLAQEGPADETG